MKQSARKTIARERKLRQREKNLNARRRKTLTRKSKQRMIRNADLKKRKEGRLLGLKEVNLAKRKTILLQRACRNELLLVDPPKL